MRAQEPLGACVQSEEEEEVQGDWMAVLSILCVFIGFFFKVQFALESRVMISTRWYLS